MEAKYEKPTKRSNGQNGDKYDEDSESSSEEEDDEGFLATAELDQSISQTLQAIRSKDPRVYDTSVTFYTPIDKDEVGKTPEAKKGKPMYLSDYHRENLLKGHVGAGDEADEDQPTTYAQEQDELKSVVVMEMHAAAENSSDSEGSDGEFLKPAQRRVVADRNAPSGLDKMEVVNADKDPETFLSNFMAARAWVPGDGARFQPFESDDEEEEERAEKFEAAYNLRFEDPKHSNETLKSYARDIVAAKSVRREETNSRKKQRDAQRAKEDAERMEREEERVRLKKLKVEEMEEKLKRIKKAAGLTGKSLREDEWSKIIEEGWDDKTWEAEMSKRFGDDYYAEEEVGSDCDGGAPGNLAKSKKKKPRKPKWDDEIDIKDIVPNFEDDEQANEKPAFTLSDSELEQDADADDGGLIKKSKTSKQHKKDRINQQRESRIERKKIEALVDNQLDLDVPLKSSKQATRFRYRETSPTSFGLTPLDILMAPDSSLNQFAGLKKMAAFRDPEKKKKDKKRLGKKARLRQWRKETFGDEEGPKVDFPEVDTGGVVAVGEVGNVVEGKRKKKRSRNKGKKIAELME